MYCTSTSGKTLENAISGIPLSLFGKEIHDDANAHRKQETHSGGSKPWSYMLQGYLTSKYSECTPEERAKMGGYGAKNGLAEAARRFSKLLDCYLP